MNISTRQWEILSVDAPTDVIYTTPVKIKNIGFMDYDADTDTAEVQDRDGNTIWNANGTADLSPVMSQHIGWTNGLQVPVLTSGRIVIYTE